MEKLNDKALINAYIQGDESAINILIEKYRDKVYNYIQLLTKDGDLAEDISQDLFIKVVKILKEGRYADNGKFQSWLYRIAHNMVIDYFRKTKQYQNISTDSEINILNNKDLTEKSIEDSMITEQTQTDIRKLVDSLPVEQREVVIMRHYLGLSFKEIAEHTGVSINTALGRMRYALLNLRKLIDDHQIALVL